MNTKKFLSIAILALGFTANAVAQQVAKEPAKAIIVKEAEESKNTVPAPGTRIVAAEPVGYDNKALKPEVLKALTPPSEVVTPSPLTRQELQTPVSANYLNVKAIEVTPPKAILTEEMKATMNGTHKPVPVASKAAPQSKLQEVQPVQLQPVSVPQAATQVIE